MATPYNILRITDGSTDTSGLPREVDLLSTRNGFCLTNWDVGISEPKGGGVWSDMALADGRQLQLAKASNTVHTMTLEVTGFDTDHLAQQTQTLRQLLTQARQYWMTRWATAPVYIERQAVNESEPSYIEIKNWTTPTGAGVNESTLWTKIAQAGISDFDLVLECGPYWRDVPPGDANCLEIGAMQAASQVYPILFDGTTNYMSLSSPADLDDLPTADFTLEAWINPDGYGENNAGRIFDKQQWSLRMSNTTGLQAAANFDVSNAVTNSTLSDISLNEWSHVAAVFDVTASEFTLYVNGVDVSDLQQAGTNNYTSDAAVDAQVGATGLAANNAFDGEIGWMRISDNERYTGAFTPPARCPLPGDDANTVWLGICEGTGIVIYDHSTNGNNGLLPLGASWGTGCTEYYGNYDPTSATREETCAADTVYIANKHSRAQLTDLYYWDVAPGAWSANLLTQSLSYSLLPTTPSGGDIIYAGINATIVDGGPFCSIVWDLATAGSGISFSNNGGSFWQYHIGGGSWSWLTTQDNTNAAGAGTGEPFDTENIGSIHWAQPYDWSTSTINGVTAYWVRAIVVNAAAPVPPVQQNRHPYTICWPYAEIRQDKVGGDVANLARIKLHNQSSGADFASSSRVVLGLRSLSRGENFTAYLNASDEQNPSGITFAGLTVNNDLQAPTGRSVTYTPGAIVADWTGIIYWALDSTIDQDFFGTFHAFLRVKPLVAGGLYARALGTMLTTSNASDATISSREAYTTGALAATSTWKREMDLGRITLPPGRLVNTDDAAGFRIYVQFKTDSAATSVTIYDLILIPVDEMSVDSYALSDPGLGDLQLMSYLHLLDIDGVSHPKFGKRANRRLVASDRINGTYILVGADDIIVQSRANQRLWSLSKMYVTTGDGFQPQHEIAHSVQMWNVQRYWNLRGNQ